MFQLRKRHRRCCTICISERKLKKRPSFAPDQKVYETAIWDYRKANHIPKTAHIEVFEDGRAVLFDYERRDPLSNNAYTETIQLTA